MGAQNRQLGNGIEPTQGKEWKPDDGLKENSGSSLAKWGSAKNIRGPIRNNQRNNRLVRSLEKRRTEAKKIGGKRATVMPN